MRLRQYYLLHWISSKKFSVMSLKIAILLSLQCSIWYNIHTHSQCSWLLIMLTLIPTGSSGPSGQGRSLITFVSSMLQFIICYWLSWLPPDQDSSYSHLHFYISVLHVYMKLFQATNYITTSSDIPPKMANLMLFFYSSNVTKDRIKGNSWSCCHFLRSSFSIRLHWKHYTTIHLKHKKELVSAERKLRKHSTYFSVWQDFKL